MVREAVSNQSKVVGGMGCARHYWRSEVGVRPSTLIGKPKYDDIATLWELGVGGGAAGGRAGFWMCRLHFWTAVVSGD